MENWNKIKIWRKVLRENLIAARATFSLAQLKSCNEQITTLLESGFAFPSNTVVSFYWPYKNEYDVRFVIQHWRDKGAITALPEVVDTACPLRFRKWWPDAPIAPGIYGIPVPVGTDILLPDVVVLPMNGFDEKGFRLGYGGGYFDRTLAAPERRALVIGVSYEALRLPTIYPQPHDIPMDFVVTEVGIYFAGGKKLELLDAQECLAQVKILLENHCLPRQRPRTPTVVLQQALGNYSSPACYAHEIAPDYFGESLTMPVKELIILLNELLEAERAGAKVLTAYLRDYHRDSPTQKQLVAVQRDEADNCVILIKLIQRLKGTPSPATGNFLVKALALQGKLARLQFLNRGQRWVVRKVSEALPRLDQDFARDALVAMYESHLRNIEACDALVEGLKS